MRLHSDRTEIPVYAWERTEAVAFVVGALFVALFVEACLLGFAGFDDLLLTLIGLHCIVYYWPQIPARVKAYVELRRFRKELDNHG